MKFKTSLLSKAIHSALLISASGSSLVFADAFEQHTYKTSQSDFGGVGLMQTPTGRMAPEGEFNLSGTFNSEYYHGNVTLQLLPWLEATLRYTTVQDMLYNSNYEYSGDTKYTDKGGDIKVRLWQESDWLPETSIGIRDIGGTGLFDGEYVAATKRFGDFDVTLGIGWGYLGTNDNISNPFCEISDDYCERDGSYYETGGKIESDRWFKGPSAIFGGIEYQTPYEPLVLKIEYEGNDYSQDFPVQKGAIEITQHTPWNFGLVYTPAKWAEIRVSYERGDTLTAGFTIKSDFNTLSSFWRDTPKPAYKPKANSDNPDWDKVAAQIESEAGYQNNKIVIEGDNITVSGEQTKYRDPEIAHERAALLLSQNRSDSVKTYTFIDSNHDMEVKKVRYDANTFDEVANNGYIGAKPEDAKLDESEKSSQTKPENTNKSVLLADTREKLDYGIAPSLSQSFGGPESFYLYSLGINASASYRLTNNLELSGSLYFNLTDNYDKFNYIEDSPHINNFATPRVRTLFRYYVDDNPVRMNNLQLTWFDQLSDDIYVQGYGGYLESMFAGVGGEILYRPEDSNWAVSADLNFVSQRDPDNWFSVYKDDYFEFDKGCNGGPLKPSCSAYVLKHGETGFVNVYYTPEWSFLHDTRFKVSVGQFLGQDVGAQIDFSKQFKSGVIVGAYAAFTDLTEEEYGEGSFTKGFYISFPLDLMTVKPGTSRAAFYWQPITRDGGQMLHRKYELYNETDARSPWFSKPSSVKE